jgi:hypothetical protein
MGDGSYLLMGYPQDGPTVFVVRDDAGLLRQAPEGEFGYPTVEIVNGNGNSNCAALPGNKALRTKRVRS